MRKIAFITDGGLEVGMGHVQQSITLAQELSEEGEICFITKSDEIVINQIQLSGFPVIRASNDGELLKLLNEMGPQLIIVDKIDVDEDFARRVKNNLRGTFVIFTNMTTANKYADIAVTADYGSRLKNIRFFDKETKTLYFYGPKYWILRKEFYESKKKGKKVSKNIEEILIIFGGSDSSNHTSTVLNELLCFAGDIRVNVVLGAHFKYFDSLEQVLEKYHDKGKNVAIYKNIKNVAEMMYAADLVITSPGLSLFEALYIRTPAIVMCQNLPQKEAYEGLLQTLDRSEIYKLQDMIASRTFVDPFDEFIIGMEIGEGKQEIIETLIK